LGAAAPASLRPEAASTGFCIVRFCFASTCFRRAFSASVIPMCQPASNRGSHAPSLVGSRPAFTSTRTMYQTAAMPPPVARPAARSCSNSIRHFPATRQLPGCCANHLVPMTVKRCRAFLAGRSGGPHSTPLDSPEKRQSLGLKATLHTHGAQPQLAPKSEGTGGSGKLKTPRQDVSATHGQ
jgi:hypothetical protein